MVPAKLKKGDKIRVIAPSRSMSLLSADTVATATKRLNDLGLEVTFSKNASEMDEFCSSSIASRIADLHDAFADKTVAGILTVIGGFNSNQLLSHIDYDLIKANPKVLCGYSDITALATAIHAKTGLVTYSGVHFSSFGMQQGFEYSLEHFRKCLMQDGAIELQPSSEWSNDPWWFNQNERQFIHNEGYKILNRGTLAQVEGTIIGGNISALAALHGTQYMPEFPENTILFIEECEEHVVCFFDRFLQSLIHQDGFKNVKAILLGRFEKANKMSEAMLRTIIGSKQALKNMLVIADMDFGHTTPIFTFPIGGHCSINLADSVSITIKDAA